MEIPSMELYKTTKHIDDRKEEEINGTTFIHSTLFTPYSFYSKCSDTNSTEKKITPDNEERTNIDPICLRFVADLKRIEIHIFKVSKTFTPITILSARMDWG